MSEVERVALVLTEFMSRNAVEWLGDDVHDDERCVAFADAVRLVGDRRENQTLLDWVSSVIKSAKLVIPNGWAGWISTMCDVRDKTLIKQAEERRKAAQKNA